MIECLTHLNRRSRDAHLLPLQQAINDLPKLRCHYVAGERYGDNDLRNVFLLTFAAKTNRVRIG